MADRGIIFSAPMVRALLEGRKTQTRRLLKPTPEDLGVADKPIDHVGDYCTGAPQNGQAYYWQSNGCWNSSDSFKLPHAIGDRLYVRENWRPDPNGREDDGSIWVNYPADSKDPQKRLVPPEDWKVPKAAHNGLVPCIHMPRWASRLWLEVTYVRVQRVDEITETDAAAEGAEPVDLQQSEFLSNAHRIDLAGIKSHALGFSRLWDSLHGSGNRWRDKPWVYALTFKVHQGNIDG